MTLDHPLQENSPDTFWVWFDGILVMVKTFLEDLWREGCVSEPILASLLCHIVTLF